MPVQRIEETDQETSPTSRGEKTVGVLLELGALKCFLALSSGAVTLMMPLPQSMEIKSN